MHIATVYCARIPLKIKHTCGNYYEHIIALQPAPARISNVTRKHTEQEHECLTHAAPSNQFAINRVQYTRVTHVSCATPS